MVRDLRVCYHVGFFILRVREPSGGAKRSGLLLLLPRGHAQVVGCFTAGGEHIEINVTADDFLPPVPFYGVQEQAA